MYICVTVNSKYQRYLYIMLESLYENNPDKSIKLFVIQRDFTEYDKKMISDLTQKYGNQVEYIWVDEHKYDDMPIYRIGRSNLSLEIYFRLLIPEYLPDYVDRVLMMDVDIVVNGKIDELYQIDFEDCYFAAAPNMCHNYIVREDWRSWYSQARKKWTHYNTGILMWNLKKIREELPEEYIFDLAWKIPIKTATFEEELFNVAFGESKIKEIPAEKWNYISTSEGLFEKPRFTQYKNVDEIVTKCRILHFAGMNPWQSGAKNESFKLWWKWAKESPYYLDILEECYWSCEQYIINVQKEIQNQNKKLIYVDKLLDDSSRNRIIDKARAAGIHNVLIYGAGRIARCLTAIFKGTNVRVLGYIDRQLRGEFCGKRTVDFYGIKEFEDKADTIIISTPYYYEEVMRDIGDITNLKTISVDDLLTEE